VMSFSEPKWREHIQANESSRDQAKRNAGIRKITRSLQKCDRYETGRMKSMTQQETLKKGYRAEVASRSTSNMLDKFRNTFGVAGDMDAQQRLSDKGFQIRMYTKVDRDYWNLDQLREWYNEKKGPEHKGGNIGLDSTATAFTSNRPGDCDSGSLLNKNSNYMLKLGGPHDPSGFLERCGQSGSKTVSQSHQQFADRQAIQNAIKAAPAVSTNLPHLNSVKAPISQAKLEAPHWAHWRNNLEHSAKQWDDKRASGQVKAAPGAPWATGAPWG